MPDEIPGRPSDDEQTEDEDALEGVYQVERRPVQRVATGEPGDQLHRPVETHQEEEHEADDEGSLEPAEQPLIPVDVMVPRQVPERELLLLVAADLDGRDYEEDHVHQQQETDGNVKVRHGFRVGYRGKNDIG